MLDKSLIELTTEAVALRNKLEELHAERVAISQKMNDAKHAYLDAICPFKIGDIVDCCGWTHEGKRMSIIDRHIRDRIYDWEWKVVGVILRKDGTLSKHTGEFTESQYSSSIGKSKP